MYKTDSQLSPRVTNYKLQTYLDSNLTLAIATQDKTNPSVFQCV